MLHMPPVGEFNPTDFVLLWHKSGPRGRKLCSYKRKRTESDRTSDVSDSSDSDGG